MIKAINAEITELNQDTPGILIYCESVEEARAISYDVKTMLAGSFKDVAGMEVHRLGTLYWKNVEVQTDAAVRKTLEMLVKQEKISQDMATQAIEDFETLIQKTVTDLHDPTVPVEKNMNPPTVEWVEFVFDH